MTFKRLYRYDTSYHYKGGLELMLTTYIAVKDTPCGWWVVEEGCEMYFKDGFDAAIEENPWLKKAMRWVSTEGRKKWCYADIDEAWRSYCIRRDKRIGHAMRELKVALRSKDFVQSDAHTGAILHIEQALLSHRLLPVRLDV